MAKCIEKKFFQTEWQGVGFDNLHVKLSKSEMPTREFYDKFYINFFNKYKRYSDLPDSWLSVKKNTAISIYNTFSGKKEILSFGCGIGFVESVIADLQEDLLIDAFDFSEISSKWIKHSSKVKCINNLSEDKKYDIIYLCQVFYAIPGDECVNILKSLSTKLKAGGLIVLIDTSIIPSENGSNKMLDFIYKMKNTFDFIFTDSIIFKNIFDFGKKKQLWGWQRSNYKTSEFVSKAGLNLYKQFPSDNQSFTLITKSKI